MINFRIFQKNFKELFKNFYKIQPDGPKFKRLLKSCPVEFKLASCPSEIADVLMQIPIRLPVIPVRFRVTGTFMVLSAVALAATVPGGHVDGGDIVVAIVDVVLGADVVVTPELVSFSIQNQSKQIIHFLKKAEIFLKQTIVTW